MQGHRILHSRVDLASLQCRGETIPVVAADDVEVIHGGRPRCHRRQAQPIHGGQPFLVALGDLTPACIPSIEMRELHSQDRTLQAIHSVIEPQLCVGEFRATRNLTVVAQRAHACGHGFVGGGDASCITVSSQVLPGIEAETPRPTQRTDDLTFVTCTLGLRCVLDQSGSARLSDLFQGVHIRWMTVDVDRHDDTSTIRHLLLHTGGIERQIVLFHVGKNDPGAEMADRFCRGSKSVRRGDDLIPGFEIEAFQSQRQCIGAIADPDTVINATK